MEEVTSLSVARGKFLPSQALQSDDLLIGITKMGDLTTRGVGRSAERCIEALE